MDRRDFFKQAGAAAAAVAGTAGVSASALASSQIASPHVASGIRELRLAMPWQQNGRGFDDSARRLAQSIGDLSQGRYRITVLPQAAGVAALASGEADLYHGSGHDFVALDAAFAHFAGLPGTSGLRPTYLNSWLAAGGGQAHWDDLAAGHGFKPMLAGHSGARSSLWSLRPIETAADVAGLRIVAPGLGARVVAKLGATPVERAPAELAHALGSGAVDAVEWGGTIASYACDLQLCAEGGTPRYCFRPGLARNGFSSVLAVASSAWQVMAPSEQALFIAAAAHELNTSVAENLALSRQLREAFVARYTGLRFTRPPADLVEAMKRASAEVVGDLARSSRDAGRIHASYQAFRSALPSPRRRTSVQPVA
jgi:TRAP-type mannitol/chloroaromatic compound transport system substrate-binding protein